MLFVVIRQVEGVRTESIVLTDLSAATEHYEGAAYVVRNAPGEGATDDLTIITAAALFAADTTDPDLAKAMATDSRAFLMESEEWPE
jgi:hypothetical protein